MNTFQVSLEILHGAFDEVCNLQRLNLKLKKFIKKKKKKEKKKVACNTLYYVQDLSMVSPMLWGLSYPRVELLFKET